MNRQEREIYNANYKYYKKQLHRLSGEVQVKFICDTGVTNFLNLNDVSIQAISKEIQALKDKGQIKIFSGI